MYLQLHQPARWSVKSYNTAGIVSIILNDGHMYRYWLFFTIFHIQNRSKDLKYLIWTNAAGCKNHIISAKEKRCILSDELITICSLMMRNFHLLNWILNLFFYIFIKGVPDDLQGNHCIFKKEDLEKEITLFLSKKRKSATEQCIVCYSVLNY